MAIPPRMLILVGGGSQALIALPPTFDKALAAATEMFAIPPTHHCRLSCKSSQVPTWVSMFGSGQVLYITDNDSYNYVCAGKHIITMEVTAFEKVKSDAKASEASGKTQSKMLPPAADSTIGVADFHLICEARDGKRTDMKALVNANDLKKGQAPGSYLGTLAIASKTHNMAFIGRALGPNEAISNYVIHNKSTARIIFRPRSIRPQVSIYYPEETSLEVSLSISDWNITGVYPPTAMIPDGTRQRLRWFLRAKAGGTVEDLLSGVESFGLFWEGLPVPKARPLKYDPKAPLVPAWPDVSPSNAYCLPQALFISHIDRVLASLGVPVASRTNMIQSWLPSVTRHKQIAYRILDHSMLPATMALTIIPAPQVLTRIYILFRGIADSDVTDWENAGLLQAEMGLDWRGATGWTPAMTDESIFRVIDFAAMEVFL